MVNNNSFAVIGGKGTVVIWWEKDSVELTLNPESAGVH